MARSKTDKTILAFRGGFNGPSLTTLQPRKPPDVARYALCPGQDVRHRNTNGTLAYMAYMSKTVVVKDIIYMNDPVMFFTANNIVCLTKKGVLSDRETRGESRFISRGVKEAIYERMYNPTLNREGGYGSIVPALGIWHSQPRGQTTLKLLFLDANCEVCPLQPDDESLPAPTALAPAALADGRLRRPKSCPPPPIKISNLGVCVWRARNSLIGFTYRPVPSAATDSNPISGQPRENCDKTDVFTWNMGLVIPEVFIRINMSASQPETPENTISP
ncbi:hypothetical protein Bbelb_406890 [Branchiostoma belcheri]|nr:hypothetical protein Bbelb_406890 [Branchiostoma belcheri]